MRRRVPARFGRSNLGLSTNSDEHHDDETQGARQRFPGAPWDFLAPAADRRCRNGRFSLSIPGTSYRATFVVSPRDDSLGKIKQLERP
jgi:hypothetical protein